METGIRCPNCGYRSKQVSIDCAKCGIVYSKFRPRPSPNGVHFYSDSQAEEKPSGRSKWKIVSVGFVIVAAGAYASALALAPVWLQNLQTHIAQTLPGNGGFVPIPPELNQTMSAVPAGTSGAEESRRALDVNLVTQSLPVETPDFSKDPEEKKNLEFVAKAPPVQPTLSAESLGSAIAPQPLQVTNGEISLPQKERNPAAAKSAPTLLDRALASIKSYAGHAASAAKRAVTPKPPRSLSPKKVIIHGVDEIAMNIAIFEEAFKFRGIAPEIVQLHVRGNDVFDTELVARMEKEGLFSKGSTLNLPAVEIDGELISAKEAEEYLQTLPPRNSKGQPYIYAYGPDRCPVTMKGIEKLQATGLPVEWKDVNAAATRIKFQARINALKGKTGWPLLEINGQVYPSTLSPEEANRIFDAPF